MLWQKSFSTDTIPFRQIPNRGQKPRYFVEDCHPPIVSREEFQRVQELMALRWEQFVGTAPKPEASIYSKRIVCGECGSICRRKVTNGKTYWVCNRRDASKVGYPIPQIPEPEITAFFSMVQARNIPVIIGVDCHLPEDLAGKHVDEAYQLADV